MASTLKLGGSLSVGPNCGIGTAGQFNVAFEIDESIYIKGSPNIAEYELSADAAQAVDFGGLAQANVVVVKAVGGKVRLGLTSTDGSDQAVPVDGFAAIFSSSVPFTAITLTRVSGTLTTVRVLLAEKAS